MSSTYDEVISAIAAAFEQTGITISGTTSAPAQRRSVKADTGSGAKLVATITNLMIAHGARGGERSSSVTSGALTFTLSPSQATSAVALDSMAETMNRGHLAIIRLDGLSGIRTGNVTVSAAPGSTVFNVALTFSHIVPNVDAASPFAGDV
jgi:hypothetical protein